MKLLKPIIIILLLTIFFSCKYEEKKLIIPKGSIKPIIKIDKEDQRKDIQYSERELIAFMDSIAKLPLKPLQDKVSTMPDSIFKSQINCNKELSLSEFKQLKQAIEAEKIDVSLAKRIFEKLKIYSDEIHEGKLSITLFSFDKNKKDYNEFAVHIGWPGEIGDTKLYFFKSNKIISEVIMHWRYEFEVQHYKDDNGKTVIYYLENYDSGSGIWWYNYYFYQYDGDHLIPVLNELQESNLQSMGLRTFRLKTKIVKTKPLSIKMVYYQQLFDTINFNDAPKIINDSTIVRYSWDEKTKTLKGDYAHSKISETGIKSYYLEEESEFIFIKTYYKLLKKGLSNPKTKGATLYYLNNVKNNFKDK